MNASMPRNVPAVIIGLFIECMLLTVIFHGNFCQSIKRLLWGLCIITSLSHRSCKHLCVLPYFSFFFFVCEIPFIIACCRTQFVGTFVENFVPRLFQKPIGKKQKHSCEDEIDCHGKDDLFH